MSGPPKLPSKSDYITMGEAHKLINHVYNLGVSRQTVYNWARNGKKGTILKTEEQLLGVRTKREWVDEFVKSFH